MSLLIDIYEEKGSPDLSGEFSPSPELDKVRKEKHRPKIEFDYTSTDQSPKRSTAAYAAAHNPGGF